MIIKDLSLIRYTHIHTRTHTHWWREKSDRHVSAVPVAVHLISLLARMQALNVRTSQCSLEGNVEREAGHHPSLSLSLSFFLFSPFFLSLFLLAFWGMKLSPQRLVHRLVTQTHALLIHCLYSESYFSSIVLDVNTTFIHPTILHK